MRTGFAGISPCERLARAVQLYHRAGMWTEYDFDVWQALTGEPFFSSAALLALAGKVRQSTWVKAEPATAPPDTPPA